MDVPQTLTDKVAIVTGSSRGLGAKMALDLAKRGAKVVITYTSPSSKSKVDELLAEISKLNNSSAAISVQADLSTVEAPSTIVHATLSAFKRIDILVNNAAKELVKPVGDITAEEFASIYDLNVRGPLLMTQACIPHLPPNARIINISSVAARQGFPVVGIYASSKAALEGLTRSWAHDLGHNGTTVNAVAPGPVQSDMLDNIPDSIKEPQKAETAIQKRFGTAEEVANIVGWLAGPDSGWVSGQSISASGGYSMF